MNCRNCGTPVEHIILSLGTIPLANRFLTREMLSKPEPLYPLDVYLCEKCFLVQVEKVQSPEETFSNYAYFSSYSDTWQAHIEAYSDKMVDFLGLDKNSLVVEVASNDGCLLQNFTKRGIPVLGIEPAQNVAEVAMSRGVPTRVDFLTEKTASSLRLEAKCADLLIGNNVLAHVPDLHDFVEGLKLILKPQGIATVEFPHLMQLIDKTQFDTIYHEHLSYFSLLTAEAVLAHHGLSIFDVEELPTHGGSLRLYVKHYGETTRQFSSRVSELRVRETKVGLASLGYYSDFGRRVKEVKQNIYNLLTRLKRRRKTVVCYGAPAKGSTLLNYCGIGPKLIDYAVDRSPHKQGYRFPGVHIPIYPPKKLRETNPDYVLILPWNIKDEIMQQISYIREWEGRFIVPIPKLKVLK